MCFCRIYETFSNGFTFEFYGFVQFYSLWPSESHSAYTGGGKLFVLWWKRRMTQTDVNREDKIDNHI